VRVLVPFAVPRAEYLVDSALRFTQLALRQDGIQAEFVPMLHDQSYYDLLASAWEAGESFCVVEHDIIVWPGALQKLADCPHGWCTRPYYCSVGWIEDGLGCTRFSAEFIRQHPDLLREPFPSCCSHTRNWCGLDRLIAHKLGAGGLKPHVHQTPVTNLNSKWT
jgi:hypothetical protein